MPLGRLLAIALLVFPFTAFGQSKSNSTASPTQDAPPLLAAVSEPSEIVANDISKLLWLNDVPSDSLIHPAEKPGKDQDQGFVLEDVPHMPPFDINSLSLPKKLVALPVGPFIGTTCFTMRSYVVARDSKDSDSTHLVHYSTCQPSSRYRVKTVQMQASPTSK